MTATVRLDDRHIVLVRQRLMDEQLVARRD